MNTVRLTLSILLITLSTAAFAQPDKTKAAPTEAQKSFDTLKTLAGTWEGMVTLTPPQPQFHNEHPSKITLRVTSRGNALVHEIQEEGVPDDPTKYDHPVTMFYLDDGRLTLTHYCDAGNRPRMIARTLADGTIDFEFADISGDMKYHMHHSTFKVVDVNHHIEEWTFMMGDKPIHARFDLQRKN
jgi:hypothetical protein